MSLTPDIILTKETRQIGLQAEVGEYLAHPAPDVDPGADLGELGGSLVDVDIQLGHVAEALHGESEGETADATAAVEVSER